MKKHAIIPIFIPHRGCPNDCVFCNQKKITARSGDVTAQDADNIIKEYLGTLVNRGLEVIEIAFFGGSFTGIPIEEQSEFLEVASRYKKNGDVDKIHLSTRPDYINREILDNLKKYDVDVIELGVQSFDEEVLLKSKRGHTAKDVEEACALIHEYGFTLGIQLMIGLPGDSYGTCIDSAKRAIEMKPKIARLYPTVVINETELATMYYEGRYRPLTTAEAVTITKDMYRILTKAGIRVIRVGLKSTDLISDGGEDSQVLADYHPSFRQLMDTALAKEDIEKQLSELGIRVGLDEDDDIPPEISKCCVGLFANSHCFSALSGYHGDNRAFFKKRYPAVRFEYWTDDSLPCDTYIAKVMK